MILTYDIPKGWSDKFDEVEILKKRRIRQLVRIPI